MGDERRIGSDLNEAVVAYSKFYRGVCLGGISKTTKT
jgi:hypothetical protein